MSTDKPSGGDRQSDQTPRPEHKPFPGQPDNRPPVPPPTGTKTAEQMRAERAKYKTNSEYNAAKAAERAAARQAGAVPGGVPVRGDSGGRHPAVSQDRGTAPRPDASGTRRPDGLARPDRSRVRPFPGQPDNRPLVPPPTGTKTAEQMRAERAKYKTNSEYNAAKAAERAAARQDATDSGRAKAVKESAVARPGAAATPGRDPEARNKGAGGSDQAVASQATELPRPPVGPSREDPGPREPGSGGTDSAAEPGEPQAVPDQSAEDQRLVAMEQIKAQLRAQFKEDITEAKAELRAEFEAKYAARLDSARPGDEAESGDPREEAPARREEQTKSPDRPPDGDYQPDQAKAEHRADRQSASASENDPDAPITSQSQDASIGERETTAQTGESRRVEKPIWRRAFTADNFSAAGTIGSAINTMAQFSMHATPEGMASMALTVVGLAAFGLGKIEKRRKRKDGQSD